MLSMAFHCQNTARVCSLHSIYWYHIFVMRTFLENVISYKHHGLSNFQPCFRQACFLLTSRPCVPHCKCHLKCVQYRQSLTKRISYTCLCFWIWVPTYCYTCKHQLGDVMYFFCMSFTDTIQFLSVLDLEPGVLSGKVGTWMCGWE